MKRIPFRFAALCIALAAALAAGGCSRKTPSATVSATLNRHLDGDPATLDPIVTTEELGLRVEELLFRPLIGLDKTFHPVASIATSWAASSDGLVYDLRLDPKARWEDGTPVTSDDVAYTIERIRDPKIAAVNWKSGFEDVRSVETPDPATVIIRFQKPYAKRLLALTVPVVSAAAYRRGTGLDRQPAGSGPYRLESWAAGQKIVLVRRADQSADLYPFARIVFHVIPDGAVRFRAGSAGDLDEFRVSRDQRATAEKTKEFLAHNRILKVGQFSVTMLFWNVRNAFLADRRVRLALAHCWDRVKAARGLYPPDGAPLISGPYPADAPENAPELKPATFDPAESARLLDAAGLAMGSDGIRRSAKGDRKVSLELIYPGAQAMTANIAQIFREGAAKVGVDVTLRPLDWAAYSQRYAAGEFDIAPSAQQFIPPNLDQYVFFHSSQIPPAGQNAGFYRNAEVDRALEAAQREMDPAKNLELYRQIHRLLAADPPADFLWSPDQYWAVSSRLEGVETSPLGLYHFLPGSLSWMPVAVRSGR